MGNLLKLEFRKLKSQKVFYICLAVMVVMLLIVGITTKLLIDYIPEFVEMSEQMNEEMGDLPGTNTIAVDTAAFILSFISSSNYTMIVAVFVTIIGCEDYGSRVIKNMVARGYSRTEHYFSKLIYVFATTTIMFLVTCAVTILFGGAFFGFNDISGRVFLLLFAQYIVCLSFVSLYFGVANLIKKLGGAIALNIIVPLFLPIILTLADTLINAESFAIADYWISSFLTSLTNTGIETGRLLVCIFGSVAYGVLFVLLGFFAGRRTEL